MICWNCQARFNDRHEDCPGLCSAPECLAIQEDDPRWQQFVAAKQAWIIENMMKAGGPTFIHLSYRKEAQDAEAETN